MSFDDKNWQEFWNTGSVQNYLNYIDNEKAKNNENYNKGTGNQGADNRGE